MEIGSELQRLSSWFKPPEKFFQAVYKNENVQKKDKAALQGLFEVDPKLDDVFFDFEFLDEIVISNQGLDNLLPESKQIPKGHEAVMTYSETKVPSLFGYQLNFGLTLNTIQNLFTLAVQNNKINKDSGSMLLNQIDETLSEDIKLGWMLHSPDDPEQKAYIGLQNQKTGDSVNVILKSHTAKKENIGEILAAMTNLQEPRYTVQSVIKQSSQSKWQMIESGNVGKDGEFCITSIDVDTKVEPPEEEFDPADWWKKL